MEEKTQIENGTEALNKAHVSRSAFEIYDTAWKTFDEEKPPVETPVWLKLRNNNVVLAAYANNGMGGTGWWKVTYDEESKEWKRSGNEGYLARQAVWQSCLLFEHCG